MEQTSRKRRAWTRAYRPTLAPPITPQMGPSGLGSEAPRGLSSRDVVQIAIWTVAIGVTVWLLLFLAAWLAV